MDPIAKLTAGFRDFRGGRFQEQRATYEDLVDQGQKPKAALIACSDSRVDPAVVLQADPGDLFITRNVANLVPPYAPDDHYHATGAALEYAVQHLQVEHVIVLGHAHCGGIRSLFEMGTKNAESGQFVPQWMSLARPAYLKVEAAMPDAPEDVIIRACEQSAVLVSLGNLMTYPGIRRRVGDGRQRLNGWYFDIRPCALHVYDPHRQHFEPID